MKLFDSVQLRKPRLNKFDLSHERKFSLNMGDLIPILVSEVVPGDKFRVNSEIMMRFAPMLAPVMHRVNVYTHYFFVPNRLLWPSSSSDPTSDSSGWEGFITGGRTGGTELVPPYIPVNTANNTGTRFGIGSLWDYMGLPTMAAGAVSDPVNVNCLGLKAYQMIYNEYYRDQNLQAATNYGSSGGDQSFYIDEILALRKRAWEKDYFTSALPWAQRGAAVGIPVTGSGDVNYKPYSTWFQSDDDDAAAGAVTMQAPGPGASRLVDSTSSNLRVENIQDLNLTDLAIQVNELRSSIRLQEWLEKNARGGARYIEQILSHFGVKSSDARLQRPEYLGGGKQPCVISEVLSTTTLTADEIPQGNMSGHGISVGNTNGFSRGFEEHGFVIGIMSVLPKTAYQQGIPRHFSRMDKLDYYWPEFANLGEQEVKSREIWFDPADTAGWNDETFGYQSRFAEYKYMPSTVHGVMRDSLKFWHMGRIFSERPLLNNGFVESDPTTRIFAVTESDVEHLYCQVYHNFHALRPMPYYGTPQT